MDTANRPRASVQQAISEAESLLPGVPAEAEEPDPRWHAIIHVAEFLETDPDEVWAFACRWGTHEQADLRAAIATCILEHLLDLHFATFFPRVETLARANARFAHTFTMCWKLGQAELSEHSRAWDELLAELKRTEDETMWNGPSP